MKIGLFLSTIFFIFLSTSVVAKDLNKESPYKVYVALGFHTSFYHSWRGNTPDEQGFGQDIRIVRHLLHSLEQANQKGLDAKAYWDFTVHWTLGEFIPNFAPDISEKIKERVKNGYDEVLVGPYNNGFNAAATKREFQKSLRYALTNDAQSGLEQVFPKVSKIYRPQEFMYTPGMINILKEEGFEAIMLAYATYPFTSFSNFVKPLTDEERFNPLTLKDPTDGKKITILPSISPADVLNFTSIENLLKRLRKKQNSGMIKSDVLINLNIDADAETWEPMLDNKFLRKIIPNIGGVDEYINAVNKFSWARFTTPKEYLNSHVPKKEIVFSQDTADGAFDGFHSWSERSFSHELWTSIDKSRIYAYKAAHLEKMYPNFTPIESLWKGEESSFFNRLLAMSTTHFGMSSPFITYNRLEDAYRYSNSAINKAKLELEAVAKKHIRQNPDYKQSNPDLLYEFDVYKYDRDNIINEGEVSLIRIPIILDLKHSSLELFDNEDNKIQYSLINKVKLGNKRVSYDLSFVYDLKDTLYKKFFLYRTVKPFISNSLYSLKELENKNINISFDEKNGVKSITFNDHVFGIENFLSPFLSYKKKVKDKKFKKYIPEKYQITHIDDEYYQGLERIKLSTQIKIKNKKDPFIANLEYTFSLFKKLPFLIVDVVVNYPYTQLDDKKLKEPEMRFRRHVDFKWSEVAPFQINPHLFGETGEFISVSKENYMGVTSSYSLDYSLFNKKNKNLSSLNNHITSSWMSVSNKDKGLMIAKNNTVLSNMAFVPIRVETKDGRQKVSLNPFGTYYGKQLSYDHIGGGGLGTTGALLNAPYITSNAPTYNGKSFHFNLALAPYLGKAPSLELRTMINQFSYPPGVIYAYISNPSLKKYVLGQQLKNYINQEIKSQKSKENNLLRTPLPRPYALAGTPLDNAVQLTWEQPHQDSRIKGYDLYILDKKKNTAKVLRLTGPNRRHITIKENMINGKKYEFQVRSYSDLAHSLFSNTQKVRPAPIPKAKLNFKANPVIIYQTIKSIIKHNLGKL